MVDFLKIEPFKMDIFLSREEIESVLSDKGKVNITCIGIQKGA